MRNRRLILFLLLGLTTLFAAPRLHAGPPPEKIDDEEWYVLRLQDQQCGYMHAITRQIGEEVVTKSMTQIKIARGKAKVGISIEQEFHETLDGKPLSFVNKTAMGEVPITYSGVVTNDKVTLVTEQFGTKRKATYDFDPEIRFAYGQTLAQRQRGLAAGVSFKVKTYEPSLKADGPIELEFKCHGKGEVDVLGKKLTLNRVTAIMKLPGVATSDTGETPEENAKTPKRQNVEATTGEAPVPQGEGAAAGFDVATEVWTDDDAKPVITTLDLGVARVRMYLSTKEEALKDADPPELFLNTFINVDRHIGHSPREVKYRLKVPSKGDVAMPELPNTDMQTFKRLSKFDAELTVKRSDWAKIRKVAANPKDLYKLEEYLRASSIVDINDVKIKRLAKRAVKGKVTPAEKADGLRNYVTDYIEHKSLDVGFATASEVARSRTGDCSEHGVLLAALARAAGLPARGVSGIVEVPEGYLSAGKSAFGYHMWTQVWIAGQWVDIDGALRQTDCDPTHIALAIMPLNEGGLMDSLTSLLPVLGRLEIEIISVK